MKWLILYILKGRHDKLLDKFHESKYDVGEPGNPFLWRRVVKCRNKIRRIEPDFLKGCD